jgi:hypothetical protein
MEINRGACQARHGGEDVVSVLLNRCVDVVGELASSSVSQASVISPAVANARYQPPLATESLPSWPCGPKVAASRRGHQMQTGLPTA